MRLGFVILANCPKQNMIAVESRAQREKWHQPELPFDYSVRARRTAIQNIGAPNEVDFPERLRKKQLVKREGPKTVDNECRCALTRLLRADRWYSGPGDRR